MKSKKKTKKNIYICHTQPLQEQQHNIQKKKKTGKKHNKFNRKLYIVCEKSYPQF